MKKFKNLMLSLVFVFSLVVLASCTIIDDTHIHCFEDGHCDCGEIELEHIEKGVVEVTFLDEEGKVIETIEVVVGTLIPEVQELEKEGCKFAGWFDGEVKWDFKKMPVNKAVTLQARFIDNAKYDIIYQLGGGNFLEGEIVETSYVSGIGLSKLPTPVRENYIFLGWYLNGELVDSISASKMGAVTLVAKWESINYEISYDLAGGEFYAGVKVPNNYEEGVGLAELPVAKRAYYIFDGWMLDGELIDKISADQLGDVKLVAKWTPVEYSIEYDLAGGEYTEEPVLEYNVEEEVEFAPVKRVGYTFLGWYLNGELVKKVEVGTNGNLKLVAKWQVNEYKLIVNVDGVKEEVVYDYNEEVSKPTDPTKVGYTFTGWDKEVPANMPASDIEIVAKWQVNEYKLIINVDGVKEEVVYDYNEEVSKPSDPTKEGYTFTGWDKEIPANMPASDIEIVAKWQVNEYKLIINVDGVKEEVVYDYNENVLVPTDPTKVGYTFIGWDKEIPAYMPASDIEIVAIWAINQYTLTINVDGVKEEVVYDYNEEVSKPSDPTKEGYTFTGWDKEIPANMPASDIEIVAKWQVNEYKLIINVDGVKEEVVYDYNEEVSKPTDPTKVGYTFTGWDKEIPANMPASDIEIVATWQVNEYKLIVNVDGVKEEVVYEYNEEVSKPSDPTKVGYTFTGWDKEVPANMPANDVELVATWKVVEYTISYDGAGAEVKKGYLYDSLDKEYAFTIDTYNVIDWGTTTLCLKAKATATYWSHILLKATDEAGLYRIVQVVSSTPEITEEYDLVIFWYDSGYANANALEKLRHMVANPTQYVGDYIILGELPTDTTYSANISCDLYDSSDVVYSNKVDSYTIEDEVLSFPIVNKVGYEFAGWFNGEEKVESIERGSIGNVSLVARWTPINYSIQYSYEGAELVGEAQNTYTIEDTVVITVTAKRNGYEFAGWYDGETKVESISAGNHGNITLIAKWNVVDYRITYDADGGNVDPEFLTYDQIATGFLADFNKYAGSSHTADVFASSSATSVKTALANAEMLTKWKWYFEFILEDLKSIHGENPGTEVSDTYKLLEQLISGDTTAIKQAGAPGPNGRTLIRYYTGGMMQKIKGSTGNATFTGLAADFSDVARQDALVFAANHNYYYNIEDNKTLLIPTKAGYSFDGWYNGDIKVESIVEGTYGDITLKAHWSIVEYTISYNLSGGEHDASPTTKYTVLDKVELGTASRRGYQFLGWLLNGELVTEINAGTTGNLELVASWEYQGVKSPINYELSEGEWPADYEAPATYDEGVGLDLSTVVPVRKGYTFAGWTLNGSAVTKISEEQVDAVTLTATWNINTYTITYVLNEGNEDHGNVTSYTIITDTIVLADAIRSGYDFLGWYDGETKVESIEKGTTGNLTLTAKWEISNYTISYDLNGGEFIYSEYAENVEALKAFTLTNYKKFTSNGSQAALHTSTRVYWKHMALKETSLENVYEIVEFHSDAGTITLTSDYDLIVVWHASLADADSLAALNAMYNAQSSYLGDYVVFESIPSEATNSTVINAKVYDSKDLTIYEKADSYKPGSEFDLISASKPGYTFIGWTTQLDEVITSITESQKGNLELTAKYEVNTYKITYDLAGGSFGPAYESREDMVDDFLKDAMTLYGITGDKPDGMVEGTGDTTIGFSNMFEASGIYNIFTDANYASKWAWLKAYVIEASTDSSTKSYLAEGNNAYWRYSLGAFLFQEQRTSWPKSEDFTVNEKANGFWGTYVTKLVNSYTTGATVTLPEPTKDGVEFAGWYDGTKIIDNPATLTYGDIE